MRRKQYSSNATALAVVLVVLLVTQIGGLYGCLQPERHALLNFKRSLRFDEFITAALPSWEGDGDCCEWEGIGCDNVTGHIVMLDLHNPCLTFFTKPNIEPLSADDPPTGDEDYCPPEAYPVEDVSPYLSQLSHLTHLDLSRVFFIHQVPPTFLASMQRLRFLFLQGSSDSPSSFTTIPSNSIGNLTNLRALYLKYITLTNLTGTNWLAPLSSLQYLGFNSVYLSMAQPHHLLKVLNTLPSLLHLHLPFCNLGNVSSLVPDPISPLTNLTRLQLLNLAWNDLDQDSPVLHAFQNTTSIKVLDISGNHLNSVPPCLAKLHNLVKLDLSHNNITVLDPLRNLTSIKDLHLSYNQNLNSLPLWFPQFDNLQVLSLKSCGFSGELPFTLQNMTSIRSLSFNANSLSSIVPLWLGKLQNLVELDLSANQLYGPVPYALHNLTSLTFLGLSQNNLNPIPSWLSELKSLVHLDLSNNKCTTVEEGFLSSILSNLCHLQYLDLSQINGQGFAFKNKGTLFSCDSYALEYLKLNGNEFDGFLPSWLGQFKNLTQLDLSLNLFSGPIPFSIGNLKKLRMLNLRNNILNGSLPYSFEQLVNLKDLSISSNNFSGVIPRNLGQFKNLQYLYLSSNHFSGVIPKSLSQLKNLKSLDLSSNHFSGFILQTLDQLKILQSLDLSSNNFVGVIPQSLGELKNLQSIDLSSNNFGGVIPQSLGELKNLQYLHLSSNHFGGVISQSLGQLKSLQWLDLSSNYLQGTVNGLINSWSQPMSLVYLDLSHNQISGSIPESLQDKMPTLQSLLLNDNLINGSLPSSLGKLESLFSFDVSNNKLFGEIPSTIWNLSSLVWLHLNNNKFQGKLPSSVTNMKELILLDLGENKLSDFMPSWNGSNFPNLQILRMRRNLLYGGIPSSLCQFDALQILDLAENKLVGPIPHCIGNITGMTSAYNISSSVESRGWGDEKVKQVIKGRELDYVRNLKYVVNLDLSKNFLSGSIMLLEISSHSRLIGFNLSFNNLSGEIPKMIGDMRLLESIDLSHNHLCGAIPRSMIDLTFLSPLNLSYNNLSGPIPDENQFQSLIDPLSYTGNQYLCGAPLPKYCPGDGPHHVPNIEGYENEDRENDKLDKVLFYSVITLGFATGFWGILGVLYFKKNWRYVCFGYVDKVADKIYVAVVLKVAKLKEMVQRNQLVKLEVED